MSAKAVNRSVVLAVTALAAALALGACGTPSSTPPTPSSAGSSSVQGSPSAPNPTTSAATASMPPSGAAGSCEPAMLSLAVDDTGGGAVGSVYLTLILTNTSGQPCEINGYPGVSLVGNGAQLGAAAVRDDTKPGSAFSLAPGARATAELQYNQPGKYPNCTQVQADGIKVFPPNSLNSMTVARPMTACSNTDLDLLRVGAFQPR